MLEFLEKQQFLENSTISLDITPLNLSVSAVCSGLCVQFLQQSQLHKFHFEFLRLCGLQFCECASFTAVHKFHSSVAHLSSLRACFYYWQQQFSIIGSLGCGCTASMVGAVYGETPPSEEQLGLIYLI